MYVTLKQKAERSEQASIHVCPSVVFCFSFSREFFSLLVSRSTSSWDVGVFFLCLMCRLYTFTSLGLAKSSTPRCLLFFFCGSFGVVIGGNLLVFSPPLGAMIGLLTIFRKNSLQMLVTRRLHHLNMSSAVLCCSINNAVFFLRLLHHAGVCSISSASKM